MILNNKKAKLKSGILTTVVMSIILIVVLLQVYAEVVPEVSDGGDALGDSARCADRGCSWNTSNEICYATSNYSAATCSADSQTIPLAGLVGSSGIVLVIIMAALLILIVKSSMNKK